MTCNYHTKRNNKIELMNLDHKYLENTLDWYYMCVECHKLYDYLAGLEKHKTIQPVPNLINNLLQLETRKEREQALKDIITHYMNNK